jgi:hypothetical protein
MKESRRAYWEGIYTKKSENEVSWFQENPAASLELIAPLGVTAASAIIDVGGGSSAWLWGRHRSRFFRSCT